MDNSLTNTENFKMLIELSRLYPDNLPVCLMPVQWHGYHYFLLLIQSFFQLIPPYQSQSFQHCFLYDVLWFAVIEYPFLKVFFIPLS